MKAKREHLDRRIHEVEQMIYAAREYGVDNPASRMGMDSLERLLRDLRAKRERLEEAT